MTLKNVIDRGQWHFLGSLTAVNDNVHKFFCHWLKSMTFGHKPFENVSIRKNVIDQSMTFWIGGPLDTLIEEGNPFACFQRTPSTNEKLGFGALDQSQALILAIFESLANLAFQKSVIDRSMTLSEILKTVIDRSMTFSKSPHPDLFETLSLTGQWHFLRMWKMSLTVQWQLLRVPIRTFSRHCHWLVNDTY